MSTSKKRYKKGKYRCKNCDHVIKLDSFSTTLPPCPDCNSTKYSRIGPERQ